MSYSRHLWQIAIETQLRRCIRCSSMLTEVTACPVRRNRRAISWLPTLLVACLIQLAALQSAWAGCVAAPDDPSWMHSETTQVDSETVMATIGLTRLRVTLDASDTQLLTDDVSSWLFVAVGPMAVPAALINPFAIFGVVFPVIGPPLNAAFRNKRDALVRALCSESLPAAVLNALSNRLRETPLPNLGSIDVQIAIYGLSSASGKAPRVLADDVKMCLVASFSLAAEMDGREFEWPGLGLGVYSRSDDAPPPICASFGRFAADDGKYLRQAIQEAAEVVAAISISRLEAER